MVIKVTGDSLLSAALGLHQDLLQYIIDLNPHHFQRLEQPMMRRVMTQRMTLRRVARLSGIPLGKLLIDIHRIAGIDLTQTERAMLSAESGPVSVPAPEAEASRPEWANDLGEDDLKVIDLTGRDVAALDELRAAMDEAMRSVSPGEVVLIKHAPQLRALCSVWDRKGHEHFSEEVSPGEWWTYVRKGSRSDARSGS